MPSASNSFDPGRLVVVCAITLTLVVVGSAALITYNLRHRALVENEQALSNSALIIAKQIAQTFTAVEAVQKGFYEDLSRLPTVNEETIENDLGRLDVHLKLRDKAMGVPFVDSLAIFNAHGKLINFSRHWPSPDLNMAEQDFFAALKNDPGLTSYLGEPMRESGTGAWVTHLARRIAGPNGEFLGVIAASLNLRYLQNYFGEITSNPDSSFALFRTDGTLLARYPGDHIEIGRRFANAISLRLVDHADHGAGVSPGVIDGYYRMVAAYRVPGYPLVASATKTTAAILAHWEKTAIYIAGAAAFMIAMIAAFAFLFIRLFGNYKALEEARSERKRAEQLREQSLRFDVALNNMSQGLVMFDASSKLVVSNTRFLQF